MELEEEEEDLVLANSPLYQHLQSSGFDSFVEYDPGVSKSCDENHEVSGEHHKPTADRVKQLVDLLAFMLRKFTWIGLMNGPICYAEDINSCCDAIVSSIVRCNGADRYILDAFAQETSPIRKHVHANPLLNYLQSHYLMTLWSIFVGVLAVVAYFGVNGSSFHVWPVFLVILFLTTIILVQLWRISRAKYTLNTIQRKMSTYLETLEEETRLINKATLFLKEVEVVSMGMNHFDPGVPITFLERSSFLGCKPERCLPLRRTLSSWMAKRLLVARSATQSILLHAKPQCEILRTSELLAEQQLDDIHDLLSLERIQSCADILLQDIKEISCLRQAQDKELLHCIAIYLMQQQDSIHRQQFLMKLSEHLVVISENVQSSLHFVRMQYHLARDFVFEPIKLPPATENLDDCKTETKLDCAELHLKSALQGFSLLRRLLLNKSDVLSHLQEEDDRINTVKDKNTVLHLIKCDLSSTVACLDQIANVSYGPTERTEESMPNVKPSGDYLTEKQQHMNGSICSLHDIGIHTEKETDKMFEGIAEHCDLMQEERWREESDPMVLKATKQSNILLQELKSILSAKEGEVGLISFDWRQKLSADSESKSVALDKDESKINRSWENVVCDKVNTEAIPDQDEDPVLYEDKAENDKITENKSYLSCLAEAIAAKSSQFHRAEEYELSCETSSDEG